MTPEEIKSLKVGDSVVYYCRVHRKVEERKVTKVGRKYIHLDAHLVMDFDYIQEKNKKGYHLVSTREVFKSKEALEDAAERRRLDLEAKRLAIHTRWESLDKDTLVKIIQLLGGVSEA